MSYKTNLDLIKQQISFWDEDFKSPGDYISEEIELVSTKALIMDPEVLKIYNNDQDHIQQISELADLIKNGASLPPILIHENNTVADGYHRILAAEKAGLTTVPYLKIILGKN